MNPKFTNHFICAGCNQEFHRITPISQQLKEHEQRKKSLKGYDDDETVEVCDPCFKEAMSLHESSGNSDN